MTMRSDGGRRWASKVGGFLNLATLTMLLALAGLFSYYALNERMRALTAAEKLLGALALTAEDQTHHALEAALQALDAVKAASAPDPSAAPAPLNGAPLNASVLAPASARLSRSAGMIGAVVRTDAAGIVRFTSGSPRDLGLDLSGRDFFAALAHDSLADGPVIGAPLAGRFFADSSGEGGFIPVAVAIRDADGALVGVAAAALQLGALTAQHRALADGYGAAVGLSRADGLSLAGGGAPNEAFAQEAPKRAPTTLRLDGWGDAPARLAAVRYVRPWDLVVSVGAPKAAALAEWRRAVTIIGVLIGAVAALVVATMAALRRRQDALAAQEATATASRRDLEEAIGAISDGFCRYDSQGRLLLANQAYRDMLPTLADWLRPGVAYADLLQAGVERGLFQAAATDPAGWLADRLGRFADPGAPFEEPLSDGRWLRVHDRRTADGGVVGLRIDVTEQKQRERELTESRHAADRANLAKTRFLAQMSHEIRTPMNGVIGMTGLLSDTPLAPNQQEMVRTIQDSADALLQLINDILDVSRLEAGKLDLVDGAFDLAETIDSVTALVTVEASRKGLPILIDIHPDVPLWQWGDQGRLRQILLNLLSNAVKFTDAGRIDVTATQFKPGWMELSVRDTGCGVPPSAMPRLFRNFEQAEQNTQQRFGGTGLGLAICRRLAQLMGGVVGVDSTLHVGSRFWVRLPIREPEAPRPAVPVSAVSAAATAAVPSAAAPSAGAATRRLRILAAEDNQTNQRVLRGMLERLGHHCDLVADGLEAVAALQAAPYDLVLMDVQMPRLDGVGATQAIRALAGQVAQTPILAVTANVMAGDAERYLAAGMTGLLPKPLRADALAQALAPFAAAAQASEASAPEPPSLVADGDRDGDQDGDGDGPDRGAAPSEATLSETAPSETAPISVDRAALSELRASVGEAIIPEILEDFRADVAVRFGELNEGLAAGKPPLVRAALHALASLYALFGLSALGRLCREAEEAGRSGDVEGMFGRARRVMATNDAAQAALDVALASGES